MDRTKEHLLFDLIASHRQLNDQLLSVADDQDWQPDHDSWSFRYLAAHLATTEQECFWERLKRVISEDNPHFEYYLNSGRDFSQINLRDSLQSWELVRQHLLKITSVLDKAPTASL